jgi:hypothetical protein
VQRTSEAAWWRARSRPATPQASPTLAPAGEFSAKRAYADVQRMAGGGPTVTACLLSAMSYYGSLAVMGAGGGALIALLLHQRWPGSRVVALTAGAVPALLVLVLGVGGWVYSASQTAWRWCSCLFSLA